MSVVCCGDRIRTYLGIVFIRDRGGVWEGRKKVRLT